MPSADPACWGISPEKRGVQDTREGGGGVKCRIGLGQVSAVLGKSVHVFAISGVSWEADIALMCLHVPCSLIKSLEPEQSAGCLERTRNSDFALKSESAARNPTMDG